MNAQELSLTEDLGKKVAECNIFQVSWMEGDGGSRLCAPDGGEQGTAPGLGPTHPCPCPQGHNSCLEEPELPEPVLVLLFLLCRALLSSVTEIPHVLHLCRIT